MQTAYVENDASKYSIVSWNLGSIVIAAQQFIPSYLASSLPADAMRQRVRFAGSGTFAVRFPYKIGWARGSSHGAAQPHVAARHPDREIRCAFGEQTPSRARYNKSCNSAQPEPLQPAPANQERNARKAQDGEKYEENNDHPSGYGGTSRARLCGE
jgi:hypothetical protein